MDIGTDSKAVDLWRKDFIHGSLHVWNAEKPPEQFPIHKVKKKNNKKHPLTLPATFLSFHIQCRPFRNSILFFTGIHQGKDCEF